MSSTYLINMHPGLIFFMTAGVFAAVLFGVIFLSIWLSKKTKMPSSFVKAVFFVSLFFCAALVFGGISFIKSTKDMGGVRKIFILQTEGNPRLAVWCTRIFGKKSGADYEQHIRTFDLMSARLLGSVKIDGKYRSDDYRLYWPGGRNAWGYRKDKGLTLINIVMPAVVADPEQLIARNPVLAKGFEFKGFRDLADPDQSGVYVKSANGSTYRLKDDLSAVPANSVPIDENAKHAASFPGNWRFYNLKNSKGKHAHTKGAPCTSDKSATLLEPAFIPEMNSSVSPVPRGSEVWVTHKSALLGDYDILLSYMSEDGVARNTLNVSKLVPLKKLKVISTVVIGKEVLIFVGAGDTLRSSVLGFSLSALRTDVETGELLGMLTYF